MINYVLRCLDYAINGLNPGLQYAFIVLTLNVEIAGLILFLCSFLGVAHVNVVIFTQRNLAVFSLVMLISKTSLFSHIVTYSMFCSNNSHALKT